MTMEQPAEDPPKLWFFPLKEQLMLGEEHLIVSFKAPFDPLFYRSLPVGFVAFTGDGGGEETVRPCSPEFSS